MKANKALKRLTKIEALISDVTERYSTRAPRIRELLQDAKAAVARAKEAVSLQASSGTAKAWKARPKVKPEPAKQKRRLSAGGRRAIQEAARRRWAQNRATANVNRPAKKVAAARKKTAVKKAAAKTPTAQTVKKNVPIKKAAKKATAKKTAQVPVPAPPLLQAATKPAAQQSGI